MREKPLWKIVGNWLMIHISAMVLCLILGWGVLCLGQSLPMQIIASLLCVVVYWGVINKPAWKLGNDDLNKVKFGHKEADLWRGFKIGLLTALPFIIMAVLLILSKLFCNAFLLFTVHVYPFLTHKYAFLATPQQPYVCRLRVSCRRSVG